MTLNKNNITGIVLYILFLNIIQVTGQSKTYSEKFVSKRANINPFSLIDSAKHQVLVNPQLSFEFIEEALTYSIQTKNILAEGMSYRFLGNINHQIKQFDIANNYYVKAIQIFKNSGNLNYLNETYIDYSRSLIDFKQIDEGIKFLNLSLNYFEGKNDLKKSLEIKNLIAEAYQSKGDYKKALGYFNIVLKEEETANNMVGVVETQQKIGELYLKDSQNEEAIYSYNQSVQNARSIDDKKLLSNSLKSQSNALRKSKKFKQELEVRKELSDLNYEEKNIPEMVDNKIEMADLYIELDDEEQAEQEILESIELSNRSGYIEKSGIAYKKLSSVYDKKKDYNKALEAYKKYVISVDKIHARQKKEIQSSIELYANLNRKLQRLNMLEKDLELNRKNMALLQQEKDINNKELTVQRKITYALLVVLFILTLATFLIYRSSLNKRKTNQLLALKSLRSQMNPHFIYNSLNSINNFIAKNDERSANKYLSSFSKLMRSVMDNSKEDFVTLSSELAILKLYLNLEYSRFPDKFEYSLNINPAIDADNFLIPPMLIQPFLENAIWHGLRYKEEKGFLNLDIQKEGKHLKIKIEDNGIGRKKSEELKTKYQKEHKSSGLKNIENRLNIIKNIFNMNINVKIDNLNKNNLEGTLVFLTIPERKTEILD